jgi:hypothetical protein
MAQNPLNHNVSCFFSFSQKQIVKLQKKTQNKHWLWCRDTFGFKHVQCNHKFSYIVIVSGHFDVAHMNSYSLWVDLQIGLEWKPI